MTAVLLVADTERVQRVFADLESKGVLQLHAAATLTQVDQALGSAIPEFTFVQSRISGLSTAILLRHLKKTLPDQARIVLLSADAADVPHKPAPELPLVDLRLTDDVVADTVAGIVAGTPPPPTPSAKGAKSAAGVEKRAKKGPRVKKDDQFKKRHSESPRPAAVTVEASPAPCPPPGGTKPETEGGIKATALAHDKPAFAGEASATASAHVEPASAEEAPEAASAHDEPASAGEAPEAASARGLPGRELEVAAPAPLSFLEMMQAAASKSGQKLPLIEDLVSIENQPLSPHSPAPSAEPPEVERAVRAAAPLPVADLVKEETFVSGKRKRQMWPFVLLLSFLVVPLAAYLLGVAQAPGEGARQHPVRVAGKQTSQSAAPAQASALPHTKAATYTPLAAPRKPDTPHLSGLVTLPPFLEGVELDRGYSAGHPGWERYLGAKAEYKVFREGGRYRALQAIARDNEIPEELFRRVLLEFGGIAGYVVKSTETKGNFLLEQATGSGNASLTIYRKKVDHRIKGIVVYHR